jgi:sulfite reductase (NADPH) flavoprotein alpha-component
LPEAQDAPLILIAEGTGIAPFRSFIQEIKSAGHKHPAWLIFAEQCFEEDFLYQLDLQQAHAEGLLQHVDTVFYQEEPNSTLATRLMEQVERLVSWLEEGGHLYLCGNRERLTECENAIRFWLESVLHKNALWEALNTEKRIHRNLY